MEALRRYSDPEFWKDHEALKQFADSHQFFVVGAPQTEADAKAKRYRELRAKMEQRIIDKLCTGELLATAYEAPLTSRPHRTAIDPEASAVPHDPELF
jgi:hypothetical protein